MSGKAEGQGQGTAAFEGESVASVRARWVEALRSGEYAQTAGSLRDRSGHCCIGVLCEAIGYDWSRASIEHGSAYFAGSDGQAIPAKAGLDGIHDLVNMNDGLAGIRRHSFAEIADYIESLPLPEDAR